MRINYHSLLTNKQNKKYMKNKPYSVLTDDLS